MLSGKKQINKMGVKKQTDKKTEPKKKVVIKPVVYECLCCSHKVISIDRPTECSCSNPTYAVNNNYTVKE